MVEHAASDWLNSVVGAFPEERIAGLGITDPLLTQYRNAWKSQAPDWQAQQGQLFASQTDNWVLAALTALPAPLAVKAIGYVGPNAPPYPMYDTLWYDDAHETWKRWNGSAWVTQSGVASGVTSVNGATGVVTITPLSISAVSTASLGVTGGVAQLDSTGKVTSAQSRVSTVAGRTGAIVLAVGDVTNAVSTASIGVSGGVASLDATGKVPAGQLPASGGGGGGAVTSVAGRTGAVVLAVADVANAASLDPANGRLFLNQLPQKFSATLVQPGTATIGPMFPGGYPAPYGTTLSYAVITSSRAPLGTGTSVLLRSRLHSTQAFTTMATVPVPTGTRRVVTPLTNVINGWDTLHARVTALGTTEPGGDITVTYVGVGATAPPGIIAAPTAPTALTITATSSTSNTIAWTAPSSGIITNYHVYRSDPVNALKWVGDVEAGTTSFLDTGLTSGTAYTYSVVASNEDSAGPAVTSTPAGFTYFSQAAGPLSSSSWVTILGTNPTAATSIDSSGNWLVTTGSTGANSPQDQVFVRWAETGDPTYSAIRIIMHIKWGASADIMNILLTSNLISTITGAWTAGIQIQMQPGNYRVGLKAPTYTPPAQGIGTFYNVTTTAAAQATSTTTGGQVNWTSGTMALNTEYIVTVEILSWTSGGPQTMNVYLSTLAGSPVLQNTVTINTTQRAAIPPGYQMFQFLGNQVTAGLTNTYTLPSPLQMIPLTAAGT